MRQVGLNRIVYRSIYIVTRGCVHVPPPPGLPDMVCAVAPPHNLSHGVTARSNLPRLGESCLRVVSQVQVGFVLRVRERFEVFGLVIVKVGSIRVLHISALVSVATTLDLPC